MRAPVLIAALSAALPFVTPEPPSVDPWWKGGERAARVETRSAPASDSALAEIRLGRYWHAARLLRAEGAARGAPGDVLLLARAEAGWNNHPAVIELLGGVPWLDTESGGSGRALLGRAYEEAGQWSVAAAAYAAYRATSAGRTDPLVAAWTAREVRARGRADLSEALPILDSLAGIDPVAASWTAVELLDPRVQRGDTVSVRLILDRVTDPAARDHVWRAKADALTEAGDDGAARVAWSAAGAAATTDVRKGLAGVEEGLLLLASGDTAGAVERLEASMGPAPRVTSGRAAAALLSATAPELDRTLELAGVLDAAGDGGQALRAYDRAARLASGAENLSPGTRLARATLMATVRARQDEALEEFRALQEVDDERIGARNLAAWARMRERQGRDAQVETLEGWLLERYPGSAEASEVRFDRAWKAEEDGSLDAALERYATLADLGGSHNRAGQARMREGQLHLRRGDPAAAAAVFEAYLLAFPHGQRWEEAAYWAASSRVAMGDRDAAAPYLLRLHTEEPFSYYAVIAADLEGDDYTIEVPRPEPRRTAPWLDQGLARLDVLLAADLDDGIDAVEGALSERALGDPGLALTLAEGLIERGRMIPAINLGWALRREGHPWDGRLLRVVYPLPHPEMLAREAAEWGVDPLMLAALIRQESAFTQDIVSPAGAMGLMQVMPATGEELARTHGPAGFRTASLATADVNLHLGTAFYVDMTRRFGDLPLVLSAYNAGPTRATRWRRFEEASDWLRFTERVPFAETRGYIKNVSRNLRLYRILYRPSA